MLRTSRLYLRYVKSYATRGKKSCTLTKIKTLETINFVQYYRNDIIS